MIRKPKSSCLSVNQCIALSTPFKPCNCVDWPSQALPSTLVPAMFRRLDYDRTPSHTYNFTITATDNGTPARKGSAQVRVTVTNVNDEVPVFMQSIDHVQVSEDASLNTVVHVIQAFDPDGDDVTYSFRGESLFYSYPHTNMPHFFGSNLYFLLEILSIFV